MVTINFHNGGGYFSYYMGIAQYLYEKYDLSDCEFYSCSAGVFAAVSLALELSPKKFFLKTSIPHLKKTRKLFPSTFLNWCKYESFYIQQSFNNYLKDEDFEQNKKKIFIQVFDVKNFQSYYVNEFESKEQLCNYMVASTTLPFLFTTYTNCYVNINNKILIDGGFGQNPKNCDINITPSVFRERKMIDFWPSTSFGKNIELFNNGYNDAQDNSNFFYKLKLKNNNDVHSKL